MTKPTITIRKLGDNLFEISPPTASIADAVARIDADLADTLRRGLHSTFDEACGAAATLAVACDWTLRDDTGRLDEAGIAEVMAYAAALRERRA